VSITRPPEPVFWEAFRSVPTLTRLSVVSADYYHNVSGTVFDLSTAFQAFTNLKVVRAQGGMWAWQSSSRVH
jgi:hypothetical protein